MDACPKRLHALLLGYLSLDLQSVCSENARLNGRKDSLERTELSEQAG
jgi:hypothetical protein